MNTHVRDNLLETAPAKVTTAGDVVYATGANTLTRLAAGDSGDFLRGGSPPAWSNTLTDQLVLTDATGVNLRTFNDSAVDTSDYIEWDTADEGWQVFYHDDSAATNFRFFNVAMKDYILHTGAYGQSFGALVIGTDTNSGGALTTSGGIVLEASALATGGPAYVKGFWMVRLIRTSAASVSSIDILPRNDGTNFTTAMRFDDPNRVSQSDVMPAVNDEHVFTGMFWERHTVADTSDYEIFIVAGDNSRFEFVTGHLYVESIQYPT